MSEHWAIAVTHPQQEQKVVVNAARQGLEGWYPRLRTKTYFAGRRIVHVQALFPSYVFVAVREAWRSLSGIIGVSAVLMAGEKPAMLSGTIMSDIRAHCDLAGFYQNPPIPKFKSGQHVRVTAGAFYGFTGSFEKMNGEDRAMVLLQLLGRSVRVALDERDLMAA